MPPVCASCGTVVSERQNFCAVCGHSLTDADSRADPTELEAPPATAGSVGATGRPDAAQAPLLNWGWLRFRGTPWPLQILAWPVIWPMLAGLFLAQLLWPRARPFGALAGVALLTLGALMQAGYVGALVSLQVRDDRPQAVSEGTPTPAPTPRATLRGVTSTPGPTFVVYDREDVSYDFTNLGRGRARRVVLHVEVKHYPISERFLRRLTTNLVGDERGKGWHAIAVHIRYDRREAIPAFAVIDWAPDGDWGEAERGNPNTWNDYKFKWDFKPKVTSPAECSAPSEEAFTFDDEFNAAFERNPDADEEAVIGDSARRHGTTRERVFEGIEAAESWSLC